MRDDLWRVFIVRPLLPVLCLDEIEQLRVLVLQRCRHPENYRYHFPVAFE